MQKTALILGSSGKIGRHSADAFKAAGWRVKLYKRGKDDLQEMARDVDVIVNGMNPPNYHNWQEEIPRITEAAIAAAKVNNATIILPGNVYHFGDAPGVWSETTIPHPVSRKGQIRLDMEARYRESGVQTIVLRAGDFIDPNRQGCAMTLIYLRAIKRGKITLPSAPEIGRAFCFIPDWARAAVELADMRDKFSNFEDIPFAGHTLTAHDIKSSLECILGRELKYTRFPWWLMKISAPFWELAQEMNEMRYLWDTDHALSDLRLNVLLPNFKPSRLDAVLKAVLPPEVHLS